MTIGKLIRRTAFAVAAAAALAATPAFAQKTKLTVYTALENDQLEPFKKAFEADNPTVEIAWVRDSTGVVAAKLMEFLLEKPNDAKVICSKIVDAARAYDPALVNPDALPYTSLILLVELAVGTLGVVTLFDARRMVTVGYVQMGAIVVVSGALLALSGVVWALVWVVSTRRDRKSVV